MLFQKTYGLEDAIENIKHSLLAGSTSGDGPFTERCEHWLQDHLSCEHVFMTSSCTHALEIALRALQLEPEDEVIIPSFSYPSAANAVLLAGGTVVYSEVEPVHLNIDPVCMEEKITAKTKAIIVIHYGGIPCDMNVIMQIAGKHHLWVIEDAAQSFLSQYHNRYAGTIGHFGCFSFHGTKDIIAGEGGALLVNDPQFVKACSTFRNKGTNRDDYLKGLIPFYEWVSVGSSSSPSDILMALLWSQLEKSKEIIDQRRKVFENYQLFFENHSFPHLVSFSKLSAGETTDGTKVNGHLFYLIFKEEQTAKACVAALKQKDIPLYYHFVPLHESEMGKIFIRENNHFDVEEGLGQKLVRLPIYPELTYEMQEHILMTISEFFGT